MINLNHFERCRAGETQKCNNLPAHVTQVRARDGVCPMPAPHPHEMNRRLVERGSCVDRHDKAAFPRLFDLPNRVGLGHICALAGGIYQVREQDRHLLSQVSRLRFGDAFLEFERKHP